MAQIERKGTDPCPCGSGNILDGCCGPYLAGAPAPTAEALMRARYTAYTAADLDFIERSTHSRSRAAFNRESALEWAEQSEWRGLEILGAAGGGEGDSEGTVEFIATYVRDGETVDHHEIASFRREDGAWAFVDGRITRRPFRRDQPKTGRNDPCPCGSGKKYKKCCGQGQA
ncbi:MAG: YchJ family protein [Acidobacteria bacterium]|jgi:SEC-C motif-containing protein|nr:YchJ family protein [Acidobacteriota bacterium]